MRGTRLRPQSFKQAGKVSELLFLAFNLQIVALDKHTGEVCWVTKLPNPIGGASYPAVLVDGEKLYASFNGFAYCLDGLTGQVRWENPLKGLGIGVPVLAVAGHGSSSAVVAAAGASRAR